MRCPKPLERLILARAVPWEAHAELAWPRGWWRTRWDLPGKLNLHPRAHHSPPHSHLFIPDQEELDEEINNLRKELRVKVNRLYEAQGKCSYSGTCSVPGSRLVHQEGPEILWFHVFPQPLFHQFCSSLPVPAALSVSVWSCHPPLKPL